MSDLYSFLTGPALWFAFIIFIGGLAVRITFLYGLSKERDRVFYNHMDHQWAFRSILHWLIPWGSISMRSQPVFTFMFFIFHICLFAIPLFLLAHNMLWEEAFGISLWSMSDAVADTLTIVFMVTVLFLFLRRVIKPEVRILTSAWDYSLLLLTLAPFLTGFLAYHQIGPYQAMLVLHVLFAEILLITVPFSKLGHVILFFFSRAFMGYEMGARRGARAW
jgi:nitrate reductase gamma subunit